MLMIRHQAPNSDHIRGISSVVTPSFGRVLSLTNPYPAIPARGVLEALLVQVLESRHERGSPPLSHASDSVQKALFTTSFALQHASRTPLIPMSAGILRSSLLWSQREGTEN